MCFLIYYSSPFLKNNFFTHFFSILYFMCLKLLFVNSQFLLSKIIESHQITKNLQIRFVSGDLDGIDFRTACFIDLCVIPSSVFDVVFPCSLFIDSRYHCSCWIPSFSCNSLTKSLYFDGEGVMWTYIYLPTVGRRCSEISTRTRRNLYHCAYGDIFWWWGFKKGISEVREAVLSLYSFGYHFVSMKLSFWISYIF